MSKELILNRGRVLKNNANEPPYKYSFAMTLVSEDDCVVCSNTTCRDYLHEIFRTLHNDNTRYISDFHNYHPKDGNPEPAKKTLKLLLTLDSRSYKSISAGVELLNLFESYSGINPSVAERVSLKGGPTLDTYETILIEGEPLYVFNPHLLSALTLLLRLGTVRPDLDKSSIDNFYKSLLASGAKSLYKDYILAKPCVGILHRVMAEREKLFNGLSTKELFPMHVGSAFHSAGGINSLCQCCSNSVELNDRISVMLEQQKSYISSLS